MKNNSLAKFVCNIGEIPLLPVIDHHAQTIWVTVGSWRGTRELNWIKYIREIQNNTFQFNVRYTCNVNWSPHEAVIVEETGGPLGQQHLHTASVAFLSSQVEHRSSCSVLHIHIGCSLGQHTQRLPVSLVSLTGQKEAVRCLLILDYSWCEARQWLICQTLTARCSGLTGILLSMSPSALKDISRS